MLVVLAKRLLNERTCKRHQAVNYHIHALIFNKNFVCKNVEVQICHNIKSKLRIGPILVP